MRKRKFDLRPLMKVECGDLKWSGKAESFDYAVIAALSKDIPVNPSLLLRVWDGSCWQYIDFLQALKIAGYTVRKTKNGFSVR